MFLCSRLRSGDTSDVETSTAEGESPVQGLSEARSDERDIFRVGLFGNEVLTPLRVEVVRTI